MPLYDHLYGTAHKSSDDLYEHALQGREEAPPDVVHLTHLTTPASLLRVRLGFASLAAAPSPLASRYCGSVLAAAARPVAALVAALLGRTAFRSEANRLHKLNLETWVVPRYTSQVRTTGIMTASPRSCAKLTPYFF
jgi:aldehyde decarbonylase